MKIKP